MVKLYCLTGWMTKTKDNTEEKILEAAKAVFMKYGLYGARMQEIADAAKINKALLHYYFRSKEKLFDKVFEGALHKYFQQMDVFSENSLPIKQRIFKYIDNIFEFQEEYPQMSMFIVKEISINPELFREKVSVIKKNKQVSLVKVLEQGIASGEIKKMDPVQFWINLHSLCSFPFLAEPMFRYVLKMRGEGDFSITKHKQSVKQFVENSLKTNVL